MKKTYIFILTQSYQITHPSLHTGIYGNLCSCVYFSYRTVVRPSYKVVYRTVTSLEWKCCPGFSGAACGEGKWRQKDSCTLFKQQQKVMNNRRGPWKGANFTLLLRLCFLLLSFFISSSLPPFHHVHPSVVHCCLIAVISIRLT